MRITLPALAAVLCAACGGGGQHDNPDAPNANPDAIPPDASAPDARAVGSIQVHTQVRCCDQPWGSPASGVTIHLIAPDGTLASTVTTGAEGSVTFDDVVAGSAVMSIYPETAVNPVTITTILAVEPGDTLVFGDRYYEPQVATSNGGHFTLDFPPIAASWVLPYLPCGGAAQLPPSPPQMPWLYQACETPSATVPVFAVDASAKIVASAVLRDIDLAIGASYTIDAWTPAIVKTATATVPPATQEADLALTWRYPTSARGEREPATITTGVASATFSAPDGADGAAATALLYHDGLGSQGHAVAVATDVASADVPIVDLPWLGAAQVEIANQRVLWDQPGGPGGGDALYLHLVYEHADGTGYVEWNLIAPPAAAQLSWAGIPAELPAPRGTDVDDVVAVRFTELPTASSYRELRAAPEWQIRCPLCSVDRGELSSGAQTADENGWVER
jgi:hypothetical protein